MGLFSRSKPAAAPAGTGQGSAREALVTELAGRIGRADPSTRTRQGQIEALPGGREMAADAVRRAAADQWRR